MEATIWTRGTGVVLGGLAGAAAAAALLALCFTDPVSAASMGGPFFLALIGATVLGASVVGGLQAGGDGVLRWMGLAAVQGTLGLAASAVGLVMAAGALERAPADQLALLGSRALFVALTPEVLGLGLASATLVLGVWVRASRHPRGHQPARGSLWAVPVIALWMIHGMFHGFGGAAAVACVWLAGVLGARVARPDGFGVLAASMAPGLAALADLRAGSRLAWHDFADQGVTGAVLAASLLLPAMWGLLGLRAAYGARGEAGVEQRTAVGAVVLSTCLGIAAMGLALAELRVLALAGL